MVLMLFIGVDVNDWLFGVALLKDMDNEKFIIIGICAGSIDRLGYILKLLAKYLDVFVDTMKFYDVVVYLSDMDCYTNQ